MPTQSLYFKQLELGPMQNFVYLVGDPATRSAAVIDPGWEAEKIVSALDEDGFLLSQVLLTHSHFDHCSAVRELLSIGDAPVYIHEDEASSLEAKPQDLRTFKDKDCIKIGNLEAKVIHTPGHTPGSSCFLIQDRLFTGDTLFVGACGRSDLPGGDSRKLFDSLNNVLARLDEKIQVYPSHNYGATPSSTIAQEKKNNPFLQIGKIEEFLNLTGG